jgi:hypothetical protein
MEKEMGVNWDKKGNTSLNRKEVPREEGIALLLEKE